MLVLDIVVSFIGSLNERGVLARLFSSHLARASMMYGVVGGFDGILAANAEDAQMSMNVKHLKLIGCMIATVTSNVSEDAG